MNLKKLRTQQGYTQKNVADFLGCSTVVYSRYETGDRMPSVDLLIQLADFFDVTMDELVGRQTHSAAYILSEEEVKLVNASRASDCRAREDALRLLTNHKKG